LNNRIFFRIFVSEKKFIMGKLKILYISQEITPYLPETEISKTGRYLPQAIQEKGREIRTFMPRYKCINERRNQLHEVIRLSGMNLIIDDTDHPLIIKVASIQVARMQVYFIDNEDYFCHKTLFRDNEGEFFPDNDERIIFFARGVIETVNKLQWSPDIIHCHGWFSSLVPFYIKKHYHENPLFANSKIVYSAYNEGFPEKIDPNLPQKAMLGKIKAEDVETLQNPDYNQLMKCAFHFSDGIVKGSDELDPKVLDIMKESNKPVLDYQDIDNGGVDAYNDFYDKIAAL